MIVFSIIVILVIMFSAWLKDAFDKTGKKRSDLARSLKTSPARITDMLNGIRMPQALEIASIAKFFGVSYEQVVDAISAQGLFRVEADVSGIDPKRLKIAVEAVESVILERKLKPAPEQIAEWYAQVYQETLKYELQGETTSPKVVAELLIRA